MMFIELHSSDGRPVTINADYLTSFTPDSSVPGANAFVSVIGDTVDYVGETYDEIKHLIFGAVEEQAEGE